MFEVVYYPMCMSAKTVCENTTKLAEAIATELGVQAEDTQAKEELTKDSFVFLGSGCYSSKTWGQLREFIARNDFKDRQVALFGTSLIGKSNKLKRVEELLEPAGALIRGSFYCERKALPFLHRGHTSNEELAGVKEFTNEMKSL